MPFSAARPDGAVGEFWAGRPRATAKGPVLNVPAEDDPHLLVVDDDDRIRDLLKRFLSMKGYRVTAAADAEAAARLVEALDFDLLILDVMMPGEDGISLTTGCGRNRTSQSYC